MKVINGRISVGGEADGGPREPVMNRLMFSTDQHRDKRWQAKHELDEISGKSLAKAWIAARSLGHDCEVILRVADRRTASPYEQRFVQKKDRERNQPGNPTGARNLRD